VCRTIDKALLENVNLLQELLDAYFLRKFSFDEFVDPFTIVASNSDKAVFNFAEEYAFLPRLHFLDSRFYGRVGF
jgi:hypothetical protein